MSGLGEVFGSGLGGLITGLAGIDRNVLSLEGLPYTRISQGETLNVSPANLAQTTPVTVLGLSTRALRILEAAGITTVEELCRLTAPTLLSAHRCGRSTIHEIEQALGKISACLADAKCTDSHNAQVRLKLVRQRQSRLASIALTPRR